MTLPLSNRQSAQYIETDVVLIGAGIMSATLALLLSELDPNLRTLIIERRPGSAEESSNPWNNAGTGHAGLCELNYSIEQPDGTVDVSKAANINEQFQLTRQLWAYLVEQGSLQNPQTFINSTPHMTFVTGEDHVAYLRARWDAMRDNPLFAAMRYSENQTEIAEWTPLLIAGRATETTVGCSYDPTGSDVDFGVLTKEYLRIVADRGNEVMYNFEVTDTASAGKSWLVKAKHTGGGHGLVVKAKKVFVGAGGYALHLLQRSGIPEANGYGLFPISGQFLTTSKRAVIAQHNAKVYGKASVGAPPMSVPHLDARVIDGEHYVLFGPFAGSSPKFLKHGSIFDLPLSLRTHNIVPMLQVARDNLPLVSYLASQILLSPTKQLAALQQFYPEADLADWTMVSAGQRAQIIKRDAAGRGTLQFGTELVVGAGGTISGLLGASPGASTAAPIMLGLLEKCFADQLDTWRPQLAKIMPTWGTSLANDPVLAAATMSRTAEVLGIQPPTPRHS
ncbi:MAG: malate dehydrogenase (quinone) [Propionibacteriaceae bacterium]|jgi:malate dehydrogenase (quinone)|nr:malate dehydrogenase (quinone) [Propionibacteriaceae bacterium]